MPSTAATSRARDVAIVGDGIVALTLATALSRRGITSLVIGAPRPGAASGAAAGLLAPSIGPAVDPAVQSFMVAARDAYPSFVASLSAAADREVRLGPQGILELFPGREEFQAALAAQRAEAVALDSRVVLEMEPALAPVAGALLHPADGAVDVTGLLAALGTLVERDAHVTTMRVDVAGVEVGATNASVIRTDGSRHDAATVVLAAGAWTPRLAGIPRPVPVEPARGQMVAFSEALLSHVVIAPRGYLVPRAGRTIVGSTLEHVGFDASTTGAAMEQLARLASRTVPALARAEQQPGWAGLRPVTPDMLPILGRDPEFPRLVYSCGHSKNGILTAPLAAECLAALIAGDRPAHDLSPFSIARFAP